MSHRKLSMMIDPEHGSPPSPAYRVRTIADLARLAGVSAGTVSRALAGKSLVNAETRERIRALAAEHGFRPNQMASRLRTQRTGVIGVVVPLGHEKRQHLSDPFFMAMLGQLADQLTERGYDLMLSRVIPDADDWLERIVEGGMLDGVLLIGQSDQHHAIERVAGRYLPLVAWGETVAGQHHCAVGTDNVEGGRLAAHHLLARGARRLAFLGELRTPELRARHAGVVRALAEHGVGGEPVILHAHLASDVVEREIAAELDRNRVEIDAIAAASDLVAMAAIRVLADRGVSVPAAMPVVGYDDLALAGQTVPRLTTIRQDINRGAAAMTAALFARMGGEAAPSTVMAPELIVRDSA